MQVSSDGTRKYQFTGSDGLAFEAVYIPEVATGRKTNTLCVSSQTGCAVGCRFCFTASLRRNRNLSAAEIVGQVLAVQNDVTLIGASAKVTNIVYMGMILMIALPSTCGGSGSCTRIPLTRSSPFRS